jgi:hypothetical protein
MACLPSACFELVWLYAVAYILQNKYNIGVLTVNTGFMWLGMKRMEKLTKARLSSVSKLYGLFALKLYSFLL